MGLEEAMMLRNVVICGMGAVFMILVYKFTGVLGGFLVDYINKRKR